MSLNIEIDAMDKLIANLVARFPDLTEKDVLLSAEIIIEAMSAQLISGGRIELRGFGSFNLILQEGVASRSAVAEESGTIAQSPEVHFKPGQIMREMINNER